MDFNLLDTNLIENKTRISLKKIYGLGLRRTDYVCSLLGIGKSVSIFFLNKYLKDSLRYVLLIYTYMLNQQLKFFIIQRFEFFIAIINYKGIRFLKGLPMRGQRTSSNGKSIRRFIRFWKKFLNVD